jgi:DNA-binding protein HU-beta
MNNSDIADKIAAAHGLSKEDAKKLVDNVFVTITAAAVNGEEVSIPGFGKFKVKDSPARDGRNPATGAPMKIAASRKLSLTLAKALKDKLNA